MNFLVTGGAGFIGYYLIKKLLDEGYQVVCLDNLSTGSLENVNCFIGNNNYKFIQGDVKDSELVNKLAKDCDMVYHLASVVGVKRVLGNIIETIKTGILGTENVLESVSRYGKKVMIFSTSEVYGKLIKKPLNEEDDVLYGRIHKSRWVYAYTKAIDEFLSIAYAEKGVDTVVVRLFNTVGPRQKMNYGMVLPNFVQQAIHNLPITVYGKGTQIRCFSYVEDVVNTIYELTFIKGISGEVFNIGNNEAVSISELAELVKKVANSSSPIIYIPYEEAYNKGFEDIKIRVPDVTKIHTLLGKNYFKTNLEQLIQKIVDYNYQKIQMKNQA